MARIAATHHLTRLTPLSNRNGTLVTSGYQNERPIVLKIASDSAGLTRETAALKALWGYGAVKVITQGKGFLIMERAVQGTSLEAYFPEKEQDSVKILGTVIDHLHQAPLPSNHSFPHIRDWLKVLDQEWAIPPQDLLKARSLRDKLLDTADKTVLLHGDLHHGNIVQKGHEWKVIDPKGVVGDPTYEVCAFIRNPIPDLLAVPHPESIITDRVRTFANLLGLSCTRIKDWFYVQAVLGWVWQLDDRQDPSYFKELISQTV